jgi:hypothetical protein
MSPADLKYHDGHLAPDQREAFASDSEHLSDIELARKYGMGERTATNWRVRLVGKRERALKEKGRVPHKNTGPAATEEGFPPTDCIDSSTDCGHDQTHDQTEGAA